ncbi:PTS fructose transporter subunit IIABC [Streptomyces marispadix]|uniref:Fructose-specific PTS transporter subunit EIIC n=1 Tax=Streptomyces marispadix TaxID=2922868 RepID=A0ABS9SX84_9ACTN|nr:fructose-specific PTS transporter subunit EIIC [Streptomyces marispadix]MCH6160798.1 fructose-specific PTS transporter subunit EIIC [Streptomyces marispadix]
MSELIKAELVALDLTADTKDEAARALAERMRAEGRVTDLEGFLEDVAAREAQMPTGLEGGIGIPHCRSAHVDEPTLAFGRAAVPIDFGAADGPADLIFLIAAPDGAHGDHVGILSRLARQLADEDFAQALRSVSDPVQAAALIRGDSTADAASGTETGLTEATSNATPGAGESPSSPEPVPEPVPKTQAERAGAEGESTSSGANDDGDAADGPPFRIVAVTSCPTGIAHTYMAAESLERAGRDAGAEVVVETQGSAGFERVDPAVIAAADGVIFAHDVEIREKERFEGKPTVDTGVKAAINRPAQLVAEVRAKAERGELSVRAPRHGTPVDAAGEPGDGYGTRLRKWLMTGVSYMVPFVAAGGLLIAISFAVGGYGIADAKSVADHFLWTELQSWAALFNQIGQLAFSFLVPVLAGYIAYGMADRPGLVPGFVGGAVAVEIEAGFLGGLVAGLLAGALVSGVRRVAVPRVLRGIMPVVVIPLLSSAVVGTLMFVLIGKPVATAQKAMTDWLGSLTGANAVLLGLLIGLMMCFDLGGPVNKVAYTFATGGIATSDPGNGSLTIMAAAMAAGMVPPLGMALATVVRGRLFTTAERENGKAAWVLGASFITEGAIPFAAADPLRVIPSSMAGGAVTGALTMTFGSTLRAPHGGVFVVPLIGSPLQYLVAIAAGTAVTTGLVVLLKGARGRRSSGAGGTGGKPEGKRDEKREETAGAAVAA